MIEIRLTEQHPATNKKAFVGKIRRSTAEVMTHAQAVGEWRQAAARVL